MQNYRRRAFTYLISREKITLFWRLANLVKFCKGKNLLKRKMTSCLLHQNEGNSDVFKFKVTLQQRQSRGTIIMMTICKMKKKRNWKRAEFRSSSASRAHYYEARKFQFYDFRLGIGDSSHFQDDKDVPFSCQDYWIFCN